jgi:hypothetical protein
VDSFGINGLSRFRSRALEKRYQPLPIVTDKMVSKYNSYFQRRPQLDFELFVLRIIFYLVSRRETHTFLMFSKKLNHLLITRVDISLYLIEKNNNNG